jgi:hypothetical protein
MMRMGEFRSEGDPAVGSLIFAPVDLGPNLDHPAHPQHAKSGWTWCPDVGKRNWVLKGNVNVAGGGCWTRV